LPSQDVTKERKTMREKVTTHEPPRWETLAAVLLIALMLSAGCAAGPKLPVTPVNGMPYPPSVEPTADQISHVPTGLPMTFAQMMDMVSGSRVVFVGEMHNNTHAHRVQLEVIRELNRRFPGQVAVAMEMFRENQQPALDRWTAGALDELAFVRESDWYDNWGSDFGYYRDILLFARDNQLDLLALNPTKELQRQVGMTPFEKLPVEVRANLPDIDVSDPYARAMLTNLQMGHKPTEGMLEAFIRVQNLWEETMAQKIVTYLRASNGAGKKVVVLTGGWHSAYGYGVPKKVLRRLPVPYTVIVPEEIAIPEEKLEALTMPVTLPELPLYKGDFVWWVPYADLEDGKVKMGIGMSAKDDGVKVVSLVPGSPAEKDGVRVGDVIVSFDGNKVAGTGDVYFLMSTKKEGNTVNLVVLRDGAEVPVTVTLFALPAPKKGMMK
jgi:uncharacterized iron-regulated protein